MQLLQPGPTNDEFLTELKGGLQREVAPQVKTLTVQTVKELVPLVRQEALKLNARTPELMKALSAELEAFQNDVPKRVDSALRTSVVDVIQQSGAKVRVLYPDLTEKDAQSIMASLTQEGTQRVSSIAQHVMAPYNDVLPKMVVDLNHIRDTEPVQVAGDDLSWEIAAACAGLLNDELRQAPLPAKYQPLLAIAIPDANN